MTILDWKSLWDEAQRGSLMEKGVPDRDRWLAFWDSESAAYLSRVKKDEVFYRRIVDYLLRENVFRRGDRVLDIACGPGTYTLQFAKAAASVSALDISGGMLAVLAAEAQARGLHNIQTVQSSWEVYAEPAGYDLVFTALSPAITRPDDLLRMETFSRKSCCYVTFGSEEQSRVRNELWKILAGGARDKKGLDITYPFNLLLSMGRKPNVRFFDHESARRVATGELIGDQVKFFRQFVDMDEEKTAKISEYVHSISPGGFCDTWSKQSLVALFWDVPVH